MVNHSELGTTKMPLFKSHKHAIHCVAGHDSHISGNANINYDSHTILGCSYQCLTGQNAKTFLGRKTFYSNCNRLQGVCNKPDISSHVRGHKKSKMSSELLFMCFMIITFWKMAPWKSLAGQLIGFTITRLFISCQLIKNHLTLIFTWPTNYSSPNPSSSPCTW